MDKADKASQLADQIRDYLAAWFVRDIRQFLVTVNQVTLNPSLTQAIAWLTITAISNSVPDQQSVLKLQSRYQHRLAEELKRRSIPKLLFRIDV